MSMRKRMSYKALLVVVVVLLQPQLLYLNVVPAGWGSGKQSHNRKMHKILFA